MYVHIFKQTYQCNVQAIFPFSVVVQMFVFVWAYNIDVRTINTSHNSRYPVFTIKLLSSNSTLLRSRISYPLTA